MKAIVIIAVVIVEFVPLSRAYSQAGSRFDGTWVGTETATAQQTSWDRDAPKPQTMTHQATIAISQAGKSVKKTGGAATGKWHYVLWKNNAINLSTTNYKIKLTLSANGKTLTESGLIALYPERYGGSLLPAGYGSFELLGTFHRK